MVCRSRYVTAWWLDQAPLIKTMNAIKFAWWSFWSWLISRTRKRDSVDEMIIGFHVTPTTNWHSKCNLISHWTLREIGQPLWMSDFYLYVVSIKVMYNTVQAQCLHITLIATVGISYCNCIDSIVNQRFLVFVYLLSFSEGRTMLTWVI